MKANYYYHKKVLGMFMFFMSWMTILPSMTETVYKIATRQSTLTYDSYAVEAAQAIVAFAAEIKDE